MILEKLADAPEPVIKKPVVANINKWDGEDEDDVKVSKTITFDICVRCVVCVCAYVEKFFFTARYRCY